MTNYNNQYYYRRKKKNHKFTQILAGIGAAAVLYSGCSLVAGLFHRDKNDDYDTDTINTISYAVADEAVVTVPDYESYLSPELKKNLDSYLAQASYHTFEDMNSDGITSTDLLRLRKGPGTDYDIITELGDEVRLQILGVCDNDWYLVSNNNNVGFVCGDYIRVFYPGYIESQTITPSTNFLKAVQATTGVNVRSNCNPDDSTSVIGGLNKDQSVAAYERLDNGWYHVNYNGQDGYVCGDYVREVYATSEEDLPLIYVRDTVDFCAKPYGNPITFVSKDQFLRMYGENDDYYLISLNGNYGYIKKNHCERMTDYYAIVDISDQTLKVYNNGKEIMSTRVVTGKDSTPTDIGYFSIFSKESPTVMRGADYCVTVDKALYYNGGEALHTMDRGEWDYTHDVYHEYGSHGCVNTPPAAMDDVYSYLNVGDRVFVKE